MPNWCSNKMVVKGTTENIVKFMEAIRDGDCAFSFNKITPEPEKVEDCPEEFVIHNEAEAREECLGWEENAPTRWFNWYKWRLTFWGCKWDTSDVSAPTIEEVVKSKMQKVSIFFDTPWSPADKIMDKILEEMAEQYDLYIKFMWYEPSMCFAGTRDSYGIWSNMEYVEDWNEETDETTYNEETKAFLDEFYG